MGTVQSLGYPVQSLGYLFVFLTLRETDKGEMRFLSVRNFSGAIC